MAGPIYTKSDHEAFLQTVIARSIEAVRQSKELIDDVDAHLKSLNPLVAGMGATIQPHSAKRHANEAAFREPGQPKSRQQR